MFQACHNGRLRTQTSDGAPITAAFPVAVIGAISCDAALSTLIRIIVDAATYANCLPTNRRYTRSAAIADAMHQPTIQATSTIGCAPTGSPVIDCASTDR